MRQAKITRTLPNGDVEETFIDLPEALPEKKTPAKSKPRRSKKNNDKDNSTKEEE